MGLGCRAMCSFGLNLIICISNYSSGSGAVSPIYGQEDTSKYPSAILSLKPGETITNAILYGDGAGTWLGHIYLETSTGQKFDAGRDTSGINPYGVEVGSGLLLGAVITARESGEGPGKDIANMAFLFLGQPIDRITITDIAFDKDPTGSSGGISPQNVVVGKWYNGDAPNKVSYSLAPAYNVISSYS